MFEVQSAGPLQNIDDSSDRAVVFGHRVRQTRDVKWLCIDDIYQKLYRENAFDIGGTYIQDVADFWFSAKTERCADIFLLHVFIVNRGSTSFTVSLSSSNRCNVDKRNNIVYLSRHLREFKFTSKTKPGEFTTNYLTTYRFSELDVETFKGKHMYVAVSFPSAEAEVNASAMGSISVEVINDIKFKHDCGDLLLDPIGSDFTIESADGAKIPVHKVILAAHSDVFKAMLKEDTAESQNSCVKLIDVHEEDLRVMLEFIYTGTIKDVDNVNFPNLLMLADRYNLKGLVELCQCALIDQLNTENALEILVIADMYDSDYLKNECLKFIKSHKDVLNSNNFCEITNVGLVRELCVYLNAD